MICQRALLATACRWLTQPKQQLITSVPLTPSNRNATGTRVSAASTECATISITRIAAPRRRLSDVSSPPTTPTVSYYNWPNLRHILTRKRWQIWKKIYVNIVCFILKSLGTASVFGNLLFTLCCTSHQSSLPNSTLIELNLLIYSYTIVQHNRLNNV